MDKLQCLLMNKRKIEINQLKKNACKGKKIKTINVKYETLFAYFKQKDSKELNVFKITFMPLINDLLSQLAATELIDRLEKQCKEPIKPINSPGNILKLEIFQLKSLSNQYPIQQLCNCLNIQGKQKKTLIIQKSKLMSFFKNLRFIYHDFCYCSGEKIIVENGELKGLYQLFQAQWSKSEEKGKSNATERIEKKICRSLYFLGVLIQNNILQAVETAEKRKKEQQSQCGTRSEHKKNIKGINQQVSTVHTFSSLDPSNLSVRLKSEASQQQHFSNNRNNLSGGYSQKSQKIVSRSRYDLWDKAEIKQLKFKIVHENIQPPSQNENQKFQINYLSNDVENILIEQAFKIEKHFTNSLERTPHYGQFMMVDYANQHAITNNNYYPQYSNYYLGSPMPVSYIQMGYQQQQQQQYLYPYDYHFGDSTDLVHLKRSLNLVQTRKKDKDRYQ